MYCKEQIIEAHSEHNDDSIFQSLLIPGIPELLLIFDKDITINENSTNDDMSTNNIKVTSRYYSNERNYSANLG